MEKREEFGREAIGRIFPGVEETMRADGGLCDALNGSVVRGQEPGQRRKWK